MPTLTSGQKGLSRREKSMIVFVVLAVLVAGGLIYWTWRQQQPQIVGTITLPPGSMPKQQWLKHTVGRMRRAEAPEISRFLGSLARVREAASKENYSSQRSCA